MDDKSTNISDLQFKKQGPVQGQGGQPRGPSAGAEGFSDRQGRGPTQGSMQGSMQGPMQGNVMPNPINTSDAGVRPAQNFAQQPNLVRETGESPIVIRPDIHELKGAGQGFSEPIKPSAGKKEFFGLKDTDYKSTIVVFALVLIFSSNIFFEMLKTYLPLVMSSDNRVTLIGSLISALAAALFYIIIKCVSNLK